MWQNRLFHKWPLCEHERSFMFQKWQQGDKIQITSRVLSDSVKRLGLWAGILARRKLDDVTRPVLWMSLPSTLSSQTIFKADGIVDIKGHLVVLLFFPFLLFLQTREQLLIYIALKYLPQYNGKLHMRQDWPIS